MTSSPVVLFEDAHLIAVDKPPGLLTQGIVQGEPTLEQAVRRHLVGDGPLDAVYLGTVHRLDRQVSGVVLWAKTLKAARRLSSQFASRTTRKEYEALSTPLGDFQAETAGVWEDWLSPSTEATGLVRIVEPDSAGAKHAVTRFRVDRSLFASSGVLRLSLQPETGRTHQLRIQASARGLPILGDLAYGSPRAFPQGMALHAVRLAFDHPVTKERVVVTSPTPETWEAFLKEGPAT